MKKKLINTLMLAGIIATTLVGCNSGGGSQLSTNQQSNQASNLSAINNVGFELGGVLQFVGTEIASFAVKQYMAANGITAGNLALNTESYPILNSLYQATGNSNNEILAGLAKLSYQLQKDTLLLQVQAQQDYQSLYTLQLQVATASNQQALSSLMTNVNTTYTSVTQWLQNIDPAGASGNMLKIFQGLSPESSFSSAQTQALIKNASSFVFLTTDDTASITYADAGSTLGVDPQNVRYEWNNPIPSYAQQQNILLSSFYSALQEQESLFIAQNPLQDNTNGFAIYKNWSDSLDVIYAQVLNTLLQIEATDQLRVYMYANRPESSKVMVSIPSYIPSNHLLSESAMESDVAYAAQYRTTSVINLFQIFKQQVYNLYVAPVASPTVSQSCGVNLLGFMGTTESQISSTMGSWNGTTLQATCKENNGSSTNVSYNVGDLCTTNTGSNPISVIGQGGGYTYPNMTANDNNYNLYVMNGSVSCGTQNWKKTTFNGNMFNPDINVINTLNSANIDKVTYRTLQNMWNGILTWGDYAPIASPVTSTAAQVTLGDGISTAAAYKLNGNYNQSISISGYTTGYTELSQVTGGMLIFDGVHAYMTVVYDNQDYDANVGIQCLPNDSSCSMGSVGNDSYSLNFSNGDSISIANNGSTGSNSQSGSNPWYWITPNYSVLPTGYTSGAN